jgi:hypothetical protein
MGTAGYSGTPLPRKLGIKEQHAVAFPEAPADFPGELGPPPDEVVVKRTARGPLDVIVLFVRRRSKLRRRIGALAVAVHPAGGLWVVWPKRASGVRTDMTEDAVRELGLPLGLVDNKVCAIDQTRSGLRLVWRRENR